MRHLSGMMALGALVLAGACTAPSDKVDIETRGQLTVQSWRDGDAVVAEVSLAATSQVVASFTCDVATGVLHTDAPFAGESGDRTSVTCNPAGLTELAFVLGDELAADQAAFVDDVDVVAYDKAGCDIGGANSCCARHDACYAAYDCSAWSWFYLWGDCDRCNRDVVACYIGVQ